MSEISIQFSDSKHLIENREQLPRHTIAKKKVKTGQLKTPFV